MINFKTLDLAVKLYETSKSYPFTTHMKDQYLRACSSIALNLSEGNAKQSRKDKARIYQIALGSLRECQTIWKLENVTDQEILNHADRLGASLYKLIQGIQKGT